MVLPQQSLLAPIRRTFFFTSSRPWQSLMADTTSAFSACHEPRTTNNREEDFGHQPHHTRHSFQHVHADYPSRDTRG